MSSENKNKKTLPWESSVEKFEGIIVALLAFFLVLIILTVTLVASYLFASKLTTVASISNISELQQAAMRAFSGILLVLLALELLDTVKVYFREHVVRVEVILLVGLIAMGRHVLEIDLHHIDPLILFGFSSLVLALAAGYFLVKRAQFSATRFKEDEQDDSGKTLVEK
jgi:uncharacterized membrane protein (DUF373 family)